MNSQTLILDRIKEAVEADGKVLLVCDSQYANTGTLRSLDKATLHQIAAVDYDFQQGYCHFGPSAARVAAHWYGRAAKEGEANWVCGSIPELVNSVVAHLTTESRS
jgi:hypothetical protein